MGTIGTTMIMTMTVVVEVVEVGGTYTKVGTQTRIASRITLGGSAFRITLFIVATIMATSWNAIVPTPTAIGGARNIVETRFFRQCGLVRKLVRHCSFFGEKFGDEHFWFKSPTASMVRSGFQMLATDALVVLEPGKQILLH